MYKLLIVDDEPLIRRGIITLLDFEKLNISDVYEAKNGQEGLDLFDRHRPQIVLLDINMPKKSGLQLAEEIKKIDESTRIAIITGYDYFDYAQIALKLGVDDYLLKPLSKQDVTQVLLKLIKRIKENQTHKEIQLIVGDLIQVEKDDEALNYKKQIQEIIDKEMSNPEFSLTELAHQINLSTGYLSGLFKTLFGQAFQDYMLNHRLETAKLFILTTDLKNYEIAMQVGFDDVNYFGKRFKLKYGLSPKRYKAKVRSGHEK